MPFWNESAGEDGNGYVFGGTEEASLEGGLDRAIRDFQQQPEQWAQLVARNMARDWSWQNSATQYLALYDQMLLS